MRHRKAKNIFNAAIKPENMFHDDNTQELKIGDRVIGPDWLQDTGQFYISYLRQAFKVASMQQVIDNQEFMQVGSPTKKADLFKMAQLKKNIRAYYEFQPKKETIELTGGTINFVEFTNTQHSGLIIQKVTGILNGFFSGFFNSSYERNATLLNNIVRVQSKKNEQNNLLNLQDFTIQLQHKDKRLQRPKFKDFEWKVDKDQRLLMQSNKEQGKQYCMYADLPILKKIILSVQANSYKDKQLGFMNKLKDQLAHKVTMLFGNKLRFYDHRLKAKNDETQKQYQQAKGLINMKIEEALPKQSTLKLNEEKSSDMLKPKDMGSPFVTSTNLLRGKRGTIYYDQLQKQIPLQKDAQIRVEDIKMTDQLNESGYLNEVQEQRSEQSKVNEDRHRKSKIELQFTDSRHFSEDNEIKINIYQISQNSSRNQYSINQEETNQKPFTRSNSQEYSFLRRERSSQSMSSLQLEEWKNSQEFDEGHFKQSDRQSHQELSGGQDLHSDMKLSRINRNLDYYLGFQEIFMLVEVPSVVLCPTISIQLCQLDQQVEACNYEPVCSSLNLTLQYLKGSYRSKAPVSFRITSKFTQFVVSITLRSYKISMHFQLDEYKTYQIDNSVLLYEEIKIPQKNQVAIFAGIMKMFTSATPIIPVQEISTKQFMENYITTECPDYQFKYTFIDTKRKSYQLQKQWNQIIIKEVVKSKQQKVFLQVISSWMPDSIFKEIVIKLKTKQFRLSQCLRVKNGSIEALELKEILNKFKCIKSNQTSEIFDMISGGTFNASLRESLYRIAAFFIVKYGTCNQLAFEFTKQVILRLQNVFFKARNKAEVAQIIKIYFQCQYEVGDLLVSLTRKQKHNKS